MPIPEYILFTSGDAVSSYVYMYEREPDKRHQYQCWKPASLVTPKFKAKKWKARTRSPDTRIGSEQ